TTGSADGKELLPVHSSRCSCGKTDRTRPVLAWNDAASVRPVELGFKSSKVAGDLQGLAEVVETTIARANDGLFGDIIDCITFALCLLNCALETLFCLIGSPRRPPSGLFRRLRIWDSRG